MKDMSNALKMALGLGCIRPDQGARKNKELERIMNLWMKHYNKAIKILLLGAGETGKTTIIKQMKILHIQGFTESERQEKVQEIRTNVLEAIVSITRQMQIYGIPLADKDNLDSFDYIRSIESIQEFEFTIEFFNHVKQLWDDKGVQDCFSRGSEYQLPDCTKYFMERLSEVGDPEYKPTDQDILYSRRTTTDIQKIEFTMKIPRKYGGGSQNFWMFDVGGQKGARKKWIQVFDGINTILFLVACNTFDQFTQEDPTVNKLQESIQLFQDVWCSRFLQDSGFIVFLNKQDLLKQKIEAGTSIGHYYPDYYNYNVSNKDGDNSDEYIRTRCFIRDMFWYAKNNAPSPPPRRYSVGPGFIMIPEEPCSGPPRDCYWHFTTATNTNNIQHVMEDVHNMIINENLELLGLT